MYLTKSQSVKFVINVAKKTRAVIVKTQSDFLPQPPRWSANGFVLFATDNCRRIKNNRFRQSQKAMGCGIHRSFISIISFFLSPLARRGGKVLDLRLPRYPPDHGKL
jgi:hypothetical protein